MIEIQNTGSLFYLSQNEHEAVVVTTNGVIRKNGDAVLGKGQALEAKKLVSGLEHQLGEYLRRYGNRAFYMGVHRVGDRLTSLVTFPTKHHYRDNSDLDLIMRSAVQLKEIAAKFQLSKIYLPPVALRSEGEDDLANMLPACRSCNHYKRSNSLEGWRRILEAMPATLERDCYTYRQAVRFGMVKPTPKKITFCFERRCI